jgi:hypothetical protein
VFGFSGVLLYKLFIFNGIWTVFCSSMALQAITEALCPNTINTGSMRIDQNDICVALRHMGTSKLEASSFSWQFSDYQVRKIARSLDF